MKHDDRNIGTDDALNDDQLDSISAGFGRLTLGISLGDIQQQDKLGNFEIQDLMSRFNQAETLASSVQKKTDDSKNSVIAKIA